MLSKIVFLVPALSQPRCIKRVANLSKEGIDCVVYGYNRKKYDVNSYPDQVKIKVIGDIKDGNYLSKLRTVWRDTSRIITTHKDDTVVFYAFGYIHALVCLIKHVKYVYEISDILYAYPKFKYLSFVLKRIDQFMIRNSKATIMTSGGFKKYLGIDGEHVFVIPNQVNMMFSKVERKPLNMSSDKIRFAFVGSMRYQTIYQFAEVIGEFFPKHTFTFYGGAAGETKKKIDHVINRFSNVFHYGVYRNPDDLQYIYDHIDVVVACYDTMSENERIAEPNKLYEALFFCKPILVSPNIYLSDRVEHFGCGYSIDASCKKNIVDFVKRLTYGELNKISESELSVPTSEIVDDSRLLKEIFLNMVDTQ